MRRIKPTLLVPLTLAAGLAALTGYRAGAFPAFSPPGTTVSAAAPVVGAVVERYNGQPGDVMLQGFHWTSWDADRNGGKVWYRILRENAGVIKAAGFDWVWFPPPSETADREGYLPNQWNDLDTRYGTKAQLREAVRALRPGARSIADIVVNHRAGRRTAGEDFEDPAFADNRAAVVNNDECGCGTGAGDTGDPIDAARDLDHQNASVRREIKAWQRRLKSDIGFAGWRWDMVKGYAGRFVGEYNDASRPALSVGEFYDGSRQKVVDWIDATRGKSMAFDFPTRHLLKEALLTNDFRGLKTIDGKPTGVIGWWPQMSVTFLENHDTEPVRNNGQAFPGDRVLRGYAYILTHPGVPCVFWPHFFDFGEETKRKITALIAVRTRNGLHRRSVVNIREADNGGRYAAIIDDRVAMKIGPGDWSPGAGWRVAVDGEQFAVWERE